MYSEKIGKASRLSYSWHCAVIMYMCFLIVHLQIISRNQEKCLFGTKYLLYKEIEDALHSSVLLVLATYVHNKNRVMRANFSIH